MINSALEHFKIKVLNTLIKKNELKYLDYQTDLSEFQVTFNLSNGIYLEFDKKIFVYYNEERIGNNFVSDKKQYLNRESTLREFNAVEDAFDYIEYLENLIKYKQLEQFFYLEYKSKKTELSLCQKFSLKIVNNNSTDNYIIRIDCSGFDFYLTICFFANYQFEADFTPAAKNWSSHKIKRYNHIDDLFFDLEQFTTYESIAIKESEREIF